MREVIQNLRKFDMAEEGLGRLPRTEGYVPFKSDILDARLNRLGGGYRYSAPMRYRRRRLTL
jgi:hypothetical protein